MQRCWFIYKDAGLDEMMVGREDFANKQQDDGGHWVYMEFLGEAKMHKIPGHSH